jgi:hypothetical protein
MKAARGGGKSSGGSRGGDDRARKSKAGVQSQTQTQHTIGPSFLFAMYVVLRKV